MLGVVHFEVANHLLLHFLTSHFYLKVCWIFDLLTVLAYQDRQNQINYLHMED